MASSPEKTGKDGVQRAGGGIGLGERRISASNIAGQGEGDQVLPESEGGGVLGG